MTGGNQYEVYMDPSSDSSTSSVGRRLLQSSEAVFGSIVDLGDGSYYVSYILPSCNGSSFVCGGEAFLHVYLLSGGSSSTKTPLGGSPYRIVVKADPLNQPTTSGASLSPAVIAVVVVVPVIVIIAASSGLVLMYRRKSKKFVRIGRMPSVRPYADSDDDQPQSPMPNVVDVGSSSDRRSEGERQPKVSLSTVIGPIAKLIAKRIHRQPEEVEEWIKEDEGTKCVL